MNGQPSGAPTAPAQEPDVLLPEWNQLPAPPRRARHRAVILLSTLLSVALLAGIFAASFAYNWWVDNHTPQATTPAAAIASKDLAAYRAFAANAPATPPAPVVLSYHDLSPKADDGRYTVTPQHFEAQMQMLSEAGYRSLTTDQFVSYVQGRWQPQGRTVLITFDDGTSGLWVYADKILQRYDFHGVAFLITDSVGTNRPYYLTWRQVRQMHDSGRWDFGSHTAALHVRASTESDGKDRPVLTNRLNLGEGRVETLTSFEARIRSDLAASKTAMTDRGLPAPRLFAWPFSSLVHRATDPAAARFARDLVNTMFAANFTNPADNPQPVTRRSIATGIVQRLEVMSTTSSRQLFDQVARMETLPPSAAPDPLTASRDWLSATSEKAAFSTHGGELAIENPASTYVRLDWAPQRTADWEGYSASMTTTGLGSGVTGGLRVRVGSPAELALRVSANRAVVQDASGTTVGTFDLTPGAQHTVTLTVGRTGTSASVDGTKLATIPAKAGPLAAGGVGIVASRPDTAVPLPEFDDLHVSVP